MNDCPSPDEYIGRSPEGTRAGLGAARRSARLMNDEPGLVASPCTNVCRMDARTGWCEGCLRTIDEIAGWSSMDDAQKRAVWQMLEQRRASLAERPPSATRERA
jgi:uncharacterized protein